MLITALTAPAQAELAQQPQNPCHRGLNQTPSADRQ